MQEAMVKKARNSKRTTMSKKEVDIGNGEGQLERNQFNKVHKTLALIDKNTTGVGINMQKENSLTGFTCRCWRLVQLATWLHGDLLQHFAFGKWSQSSR